MSVFVPYVASLTGPGARFETADELAALADAYLASFKIPNHWDIREDPLRCNPAGKVLKSALLDGHSGVLGWAKGVTQHCDA